MADINVVHHLRINGVTYGCHAVAVLVKDPVAVLVTETECGISYQGCLPGCVLAGAQLEKELAHAIVDVDVATGVCIIYERRVIRERLNDDILIGVIVKLEFLEVPGAWNNVQFYLVTRDDEVHVIYTAAFQVCDDFSAEVRGIVVIIVHNGTGKGF